MKTQLPDWLRRQRAAAPPPTASGSAAGGPGAPAARPAAGAAPPFRLSALLQGALGLGLDGAAEQAWRRASCSQLQAVAERMAALDRNKALAASALLAWAAAGTDLKLPTLKPGDLPWVYLASREELHGFARELVRLSPEAARAIFSGLDLALGEAEEAFQARQEPNS